MDHRYSVGIAFLPEMHKDMWQGKGKGREGKRYTQKENERNSINYKMVANPVKCPWIIVFVVLYCGLMVEVRSTQGRLINNMVSTHLYGSRHQRHTAFIIVLAMTTNFWSIQFPWNTRTQPYSRRSNMLHISAFVSFLFAFGYSTWISNAAAK